MGVEYLRCVSLVCDGCGGGWDDHDFQPHYDDTASALTAAVEAGWRTNPPDRVLCRTCAARPDCAEHRHRWTAWHACRCDGSIPLHAAVGCVGWRYCDRCDAAEYQQLAVPPTTA